MKIGTPIKIYFYNRATEIVQLDSIDESNKLLIARDLERAQRKHSTDLPTDELGSYVIPFGWIRGIQKIKVAATKSKAMVKPKRKQKVRS